MIKYFKNIKIMVTPLNLILFAAVVAGLIYSSVYMVRIALGVSIPIVPDTYVEDQVKNSFEAAKFSAKIQYPQIEKNLFHQERKTLKRITLISASSHPQYVLYGTFITPGLQMAYLEDIGNTQTTGSGERRQQALKKGDSIGGFILIEIYPDKVMLMRDGEKIFIRLSENKPVRENTDKQTTSPQEISPTKPLSKPQEQPKPINIPLPPIPAEENN